MEQVRGRTAQVQPTHSQAVTNSVHQNIFKGIFLFFAQDSGGTNLCFHGHRAIEAAHRSNPKSLEASAIFTPPLNCFTCLPSLLWVHLAAAHAYHQQNQQNTEDGPRRRWVVLLLLYLVAGSSDCDAEVLKRKLYKRL
ncbi:unnamed protein product [Ectocarpus sp. CCAP 1310/34]|nr:unnamed protein product [Ectocarpus sp. CCAP 1310/34]